MGRNEDAVEAVRLAREATQRPWWVRRVMRGIALAPVRAFRSFVEFCRDVLEGMAEVVVVVGLLAVPVVVGVVVRLLWHTGPALVLAGACALVVLWALVRRPR